MKRYSVKRLPAVTAIITAAALLVSILPFGAAGSSTKAMAAAKTVTVCDLVCDGSVMDCEIAELQKASLAGLVPEELAGDVNRKITVDEYKLLLKNLCAYEGNSEPGNFTGWLNNGATGYITRKEAADAFLWNYFSEFHEFGMNYLAEATRGTLYNDLLETLDPDYFDGTKEGSDKNAYFVFFISNFDKYSGAPLMDRDLKGYLRLNDPMTVKEAIQLVFRYTNSHVSSEDEYVSLTDAASRKLVLSDSEQAAAADLPAPAYDKLPAYQGAWYKPLVQRSDIFFEDDFSMISDMGFNYLRYSISTSQFINQKGEMKKSVLDALDSAIHAAIKYGIHINLDLDPQTDSPLDPLLLMKEGIKSPVPGGIEGFGTSTCTAEQYRKYYCNVWKTLAERYAAVPNSILSFQLYTEVPVHDGYAESSPDFFTEAEYTEYVYILADAIWEKDNDRFICTGSGFYDTNPIETLAEEGIKRNLTSGGLERRILQNFHMFLPNYCWTNGFYGESPSVSAGHDYFPGGLYPDSSMTVKAPSTGFKKGTTVKIKDNNRNTGDLRLTAYKSGSITEVAAGKSEADGLFVTYTFSSDSDSFVLTNENSSNSILYIWITYPETASAKIPLFGFFREDNGAVYGRGGYDEFVERNGKDFSLVRDMAYSTVVSYTDKKTTYIVAGGDDMGHLSDKFTKDGKQIELSRVNVEIQVMDGNDYADYSAVFTDRNGVDTTAYKVTDKDLVDAFVEKWNAFCEKYNTVPMQHEMGPNNGSYKEVLYAWSELWLKEFTAAGWPWGGIAHPNANGALYDDYIWHGNYVKYDFHRTDADQLAIYQKYMKKFDIDDIGTLQYTGDALEPELTVRYKGTKLTKGTDYAVHYMDATEPGFATAVVSGKGKYEGIFSVQRYLIIKESIKSAEPGSEPEVPESSPVSIVKTENKKGGFTEITTETFPDGSTTEQKAVVDSKGKIKLTVKYTDKKGSTLTVTFASDGDGLVLKKITTKRSTAAVSGEFTIDGSPYQVTGIAKKVMDANKKTKTLILPDTLTSVKSNAFKGASKLKTIKVQTGSKKEFNRVKALLKTSGVKSSIKIKQVK